MAIPEYPISRTEHYLARANGQNVTPPYPISRIEHYLDGIVGGVDELKSQIDQKAPAIMQTVTDQPIASFADGADDMPLKSLVVDITPVQEGSGDPAPDNVRPISGWTGCKLKRTGKNLLSPNFADYSTSNAYLYINNVVPNTMSARFTFTDKDASVDVSDCSIGFVSSSPGEGPVSTYRWAVRNGSIQSDTSNFTSNVYCGNVFIYPNTREAFDKIFARWNVMVELGSTATAYEPYHGNTYNISWETEAGTVYGGQLDVTSGVLTVNKAMVDLGSFNWISETNIITGQFMVDSPAIMTLGMRYDAVLCSILKGTVPKGYTQFNYGEIGLSNSAALQVLRARAAAFDEATPADVKQFFNGQMLVYELATPQTYQLTPVEVKTLLGQNNIFADTGSVTVVYPADTKTYIDNQIAALQALVLENISNS